MTVPLSGVYFFVDDKVGMQFVLIMTVPPVIDGAKPHSDHGG